MFRLVFSVLTLSAIAIILFLTAGPSQTAEARFIRWDCSDWQPYPAVADADNQLASAILETLAANRGKTLYCGLDQSDTWTKRQVYDNAHAHNDRDRTQYDGSQGQGRFRGFTAGQEGWLTDGEHGITGVSPERIFEFPQQERRRRWKTVKFDVASGPPTSGCPDRNGIAGPGTAVTDWHDTNPIGDLICSNYGPQHSSWNLESGARHRSRNRYVGAADGPNNFGFDWRTRAKTGTDGPSSIRGQTLTEDGWIAKAEAAAKAACRAQGGRLVSGSADFGPGHDNLRGSGNFDKGPNHGWFYAWHRNDTLTDRWFARARESRTWHGACTKRVRGSRR